jgi:steroid delta-isomerase-like uncharacterized protein
MSEQENIRTVRQMLENLNSHNLDTNDTYLADNMRTQLVNRPSEISKKEDRVYWRDLLKAFPDLHVTIRDIVAQGDKVAVSWTSKGTNRGPLVISPDETLPATNKTMTLFGTTFYDFRSNQIFHQQVYWDQVSLLTQLGIMRMEDITSRVRH